MDELSGQAVGGERRGELEALLFKVPWFAAVGDEVVRELAAACDLEEVPGGSRMLRVGEPLRALVGVLHGALRMVRADGRVVRELRRGDAIGIAGLLADRPSPLDVEVVRDSTLLILPRQRFLALAEAHPALLPALARALGERTFQALESVAGIEARTAASRAGNVALLPLSPEVRDTARLLIELALANPRATHVTAERVEAEVGPDGDVTAWLSELEHHYEVLLYECDPGPSPWTARSIRQSDRLVLVARAGERPPAIAPGERPIELVLVHHPATVLPSGTRAWRELPRVRAVHHVRAGRRDDAARVVRRLLGRPVGLVLSGGGARGIAHVGVIAALAEAGIPIDYIGGTSMGAIFGAGLALGFDVPRMRDEVRELFARPFSLYDLTFPISSLLAGKKLDRVLRAQLGDADIEDLWLPFFCVSTDLSRADLIVHDRGCLWKAVRASSSIPGMFPPVPLDGRTLVDGGLVDNLPLDVMAERCPGPIIAVDVFPYGDPGFQQPSNRVTRWLRALRTRVRGEPASPPLFDILVRSTLLGSKFRQQEALGRIGQVLYLEPPVATFGVLQWRAHQALIDAGYRYAAATLLRHELAYG